MAAGSQSISGRGPTTANNHGSPPPSTLSSGKLPMESDKKASINEPSSASSYSADVDPVVKNGDNENGEDNGQDKPELDIVINNVVCSYNVRCHLNLRDIALRGLNVEYRKENGMLTMKLRQPCTTASIWSSGKITCTGANSEEQAKIAARKYARKLQKMGYNCRFCNYRVVNVLGTCTLPFGIKIDNFSKQHREASYEPELHPGVTYRIRHPKATLKIFSTGSITITAPSVANIQSAVQHIYPLVEPFQKPKKELGGRMKGQSNKRKHEADVDRNVLDNVETDTSNDSHPDVVY